MTAAALAACSGAREPATPVAPPEAFLPPRDAEPESARAAGEPTEQDPTVFLVDPPAEPEEEPVSLVEAALRERERRREAGEAKIVITDRNLKEHARGELTFTEAAPATEDPDGEDDGEGEGDAEGEVEGERGERYWRQRVRALRLRWRSTEESIAALEARAAELRNRFYDEDDGYYRDTQIKPQWDRALAAVDAARREVETIQAELGRALEEGRRAGALPGWLRDGLDLEPRPAPEKAPIHEPGEPEIYDGGTVDP